MPLWKPGLVGPDTRSTDRLPPGQRKVKGWPVLHEGEVPPFDPAAFRFTIDGAVAAPLSLTWDELRALPPVDVVRDFHCVTTWSRYDNRWSGVSIAALLARAQPLPTARFALVRAWDGLGYTTNLPLADLDRPDNLLATHHDGEALAPIHGGPLRLVVHHLYAWKSCKWVTGVTLLADDQPGYWEERGYHSRGDPWAEERYGYQQRRGGPA